MERQAKTARHTSVCSYISAVGTVDMGSAVDTGGNKNPPNTVASRCILFAERRQKLNDRFLHSLHLIGREHIHAFIVHVSHKRSYERGLICAARVDDSVLDAKGRTRVLEDDLATRSFTFL